MVKPTLTALCLLAFCGTMLRAEDEAGVVDSTAETKVYYLKIQDNSSYVNSWNTPANWVEKYEKVSGKWTFSGNSPEAIAKNDEFIVPANSGAWTLRTPNSGAKWEGKRLTLGKASNGNQTARGRIRHSAEGEGVFVEYCNEGLFLDKRSRYESVESGILNVKGSVTVTANDYMYAAELYFKETENSHLIFHGPFIGGEGVYTKMMVSQKESRVTFKDASGYLGLMEVTNLTGEADATVCLESDFGGTLVLYSDSAVAPKAGVKITNLTLHDGAVIDLENSFEVTGTVVHSGKIRLIVHEFEGENPAPRYANIAFKMPSSDFDIDDFEIVTQEGKPCIGQSLSKNEGGIIIINVLKPGYVTLKTSDLHAWKESSHASAMTNGLQWSDGEWPTNNLIDYAVTNLKSNTALRTFDTSSGDNPNIFVFKGRSLTIDDSYFVIENEKFIANPLVLRNDATVLYLKDLPTTEIGGALVVGQERVMLQGSNYQTNTLSANVTGSGCIKFASMNGGNYGNCSCRHRITGYNDGFKGSIMVTITTYTTDKPEIFYKITPLFHRNFTTLFLTQDRNLGGVLPALNRKAFTIENMSRVQPDLDIESLTLDEPTRGIFVRWVGRLMAEEGQTFTIKSPLAVHGTLWKEGAGTLVLANPAPMFGENADSETSIDQDTTNRTFRVAGGDVKISSGDAVNGLDVVFTNGAGKIVLDLDSEDETFRTFGLRNTKSQTPFAVEGDIAKIPVLLDFAEPPAHNTQRALFTISASTDPDEFLSHIALVKDEALANMVVERFWRVNEDDNNSRTLVAKFVKVGLRIVIK